MRLNLHSHIWFPCKGAQLPKIYYSSSFCSATVHVQNCYACFRPKPIRKSQTSSLCSECFQKKTKPKPDKPKKATNLPLSFWLMVTVRWGALNVLFSSVFTSLRWLDSHQPKDLLCLSQCLSSPRESRVFIPLAGIPCEPQGWHKAVSWHLLHFSTGIWQTVLPCALPAATWHNMGHEEPSLQTRAVQSDSKLGVFSVQVVTGYQGWVTATGQHGWTMRSWSAHGAALRSCGCLESRALSQAELCSEQSRKGAASEGTHCHLHSTVSLWIETHTI